MQYHVYVDPVTGWGRVTISGDLTLEECRKLFEAAWGHPEYSTADTAIWELHNLQIRMRLEGLIELTSWIFATKAGRGAKTVAIVAADDVAFGVGRMFQAIQPSSGWTVNVFRDEDAAASWLRKLEAS